VRLVGYLKINRHLCEINDVLNYVYMRHAYLMLLIIIVYILQAD